MQDDKLTLPVIIFFGLILISYMALKLSATISAIIGLGGFLVTYFWTNK